MKKGLYLMLLIVLIVSVVLNIGMYRRLRSFEIKRDTTEVVRFDTIRDTMPVVRTEKITRYITLTDSMLIHDTVTNDIILPIAQKVYSDDSTYTAYVSGAKIDSFPRLDSIMVRQKTIEKTITITITEKEKPRRLRFGIYAGYGYGFLYKGFEPQIGGGITYTW